MASTPNIYSIVQDYYGETLNSNSDLQTSACCSSEEIPSYLKPLLKKIHTEVHTTFYGCGSPIPLALEGMTVLDLGCGSGRDCFLLSALVGESGAVIGIDMTENQIAIAEKYIAYHTEKFKLERPNVSFRHGYIEDLSASGISDESIDVVISNCVVNLSPEKEKVFQEIFRVLKPGGELYFSDVFSDRRIPEELMSDPVLRGECLSGALYTEDFRRLLAQRACPDVRIVSSRPLNGFSEDIERKIGMIGFHSQTIRAFKLSDLEDRCEDYGHLATYLGTLKESPHSFLLDNHHLFEAHRPLRICGNTASMLCHTRYRDHFRIDGDRSRHFGLFPCDSVAVDPRSLFESSTDGRCC